MAPAASDRVILEVHLLNQEILRLDTMAKQRITAVSRSVSEERCLLEETKEIKTLLASLRAKIDSISTLVPRMPSRSEQLKLNNEIERHTRELEENTKQMRKATVSAKKRISEHARSSLLSGDFEQRRREQDQTTVQENAKKTTEKLSDLVARMGQQVAHSEQTMDSLVHSSTVLAQTHGEYESQAGHIQTGNKLLSKYERRELTDKILIALAMICYFLMSNEIKKPKISDLLRQLSDFLREGKEDDAKRLLTRQEGLLTARDDSNRGTEHYAAVGGCLQIFQYACNMNPEAIDCPDELGWTPLMIACSAGRTSLVRHLLSLPQVNVNAANKNGQSSLHYAASKNHREIVHLLIENGADINSCDKYQSTPLHRAASQGHEQIVHMMLAHQKIRVDMQDSEGNTPLYVACEEGREDVAIALVMKGAQLEIENRDKKTPLSVVQTSALRTKLKKAEERASKMEL